MAAGRRPRTSSWSVHASVALAAILLAPALPLQAPASAAVPPFGAGSWTVTGQETLADSTLLLDGDLVIQNGGSLTLSNASIIVHCSHPEDHEIRVMSGGTLRVLNGSVMGAFDPAMTHGFWIDSGAVVEFRDSTFMACGIQVDEVNLQWIGGIVSRSDSLSISNCSFIGAHIALTLYNGAVVQNSSFIGNYIGVLNLGNTTMDYAGCVFSGNTLVGSWAYWSDIGYTNCSFVNNSIGIASDGSVLELRGCNFTGQTGVGLYASSLMHAAIPPSTLSLDGCTFEKNNIGIGHYPDLGKNMLTISDCEFLNSTSFGINWGNRGWNGMPAPDATMWRTTKDCRVWNSRCVLNGQVEVSAGGNLSIAKSNLTLDGDWPGELLVQVGDGGRLSLADGSILRGTGSNQFGLRCLPGSAFRMNGSTLRDCGWSLDAPTSSGPLFETGDVRISSSAVDFSPAALVFNGSTGAVVEGCSLRGMERGLDLNSSSVALRNSTVRAVTGSSATLAGGSLLDCLNSAVARPGLHIQDGASRANFSWMVDVRASWADDRPVEGANLTVRDAQGSLVAEAVTDAEGYVRHSVVLETSLGRETTDARTPHTFECSRGGISNRTAISVEGGREIELVLVDDRRPDIGISFPLDGTFLGAGPVIIAGTAADNMGLDRIEIVLDGISRGTVFDSAGEQVVSTAWNASFELGDGLHHLEALATDMSGNSASAAVSVTVDTVPPRIRIASPQDGQLLNSSLLTVSGFMEPGARVFICGTEARTDRDRFAGTVTLLEGPNTITAAAVDPAGNSNWSAVTVVVDSTPPMLVVQSPDDGLQTRSPTLVVSGIMEPGSDVFVNGRQVALGDRTGMFCTTISLSKGLTVVSVDAVDRAGNHNVSTKKVSLDTSAPYLKVVWPPEGRVTNDTSLSIAVETEAGAFLVVLGMGQQVAGAPPARASSSVPVKMGEGLNTIPVSASDAAGNANRTVVHVTVDTVAPPLSIGFPPDGQRTANFSVLVQGTTEPGVLLTVNGQPVPVGYTGSFSADVRLYTGNNTITVMASDRAGNANLAILTVQRVPGKGESLSVSGGGPDWPFAGFVVLAAAVAVSEFYVFRHRGRGRTARPQGGR